MALDIHETVLKSLAAVDALIDPLERLGALTAKDAKVARAASDRAHQAEALARQYSGHQLAVAESSGDTLADIDDLTLDEVVKANMLPDAAMVDRCLTVTWNKNVSAARKAAFGNAGKAPGLLTAQFDAVSDEVLEIAAKLGVVSTPQEAMDSGLIDEWQRLIALRDEYNELVTLRTSLRSYNVIAGPDGYNGGWFWSQRIEYPMGKFQAAHEYRHVDESRSLLILTARCRPYVAASKEEAEATLAASNQHQDEV